MDRCNFFGDGTPNKKIICLGEFDSVHIGHRAIIERGLRAACELNADCYVLTFNNGTSAFTAKSRDLVFTLDERLSRIADCGAHGIIVADFDQKFSSLSGKQFLDALCAVHGVVGFVCGKDFKFGKGRLSDVEFLKEYSAINDLYVDICDFVTNKSGEKISTSAIKELLIKGDVNGANALLGNCYFVSGEVVRGRQVGRTINFPTANIISKPEKLKIKSGVYATHARLNGKTYKAITNVGNAPTFGVENYLIETHFANFSGNLYGQTICVYFDDFIRDIKKFDTEEQLINQLKCDMRKIL